MEAEQVIGSVFAIVTDAKEFYFLECTLDDQEKPSFKLSKPVVVVYEDDDMKVKVEEVLSHIVWLLEEVQKADELEGNKRVRQLAVWLELAMAIWPAKLRMPTLS